MSQHEVYRQAIFETHQVAGVEPVRAMGVGTEALIWEEWFAGRLLEAVDIRPASVWLDTMIEAKSVLLEYHFGPISGIDLIEIHENHETGARDGRIYFTPNSSYVPTVVIGGIDIVERNAYREADWVFPLREEREIPVDGQYVLGFPGMVLSLPGMDSVCRADRKLFAYVRRTTFVLDRVRNDRIGGTLVRSQWYVNRVCAPSEFFAILSPLQEYGRLSTEVARIRITNSPSYAARHAMKKVEASDDLVELWPSIYDNRGEPGVSYANT